MRLIFFTFLISLTVSKFSQAQIDSLLKIASVGNDSIKAEIFLHISEEFSNLYQWDSAHLYVEKTLDIAYPPPSDHLKFDAYIQLYHIFLHGSNFVEADSFLNMALPFAKTPSQKATTYIDKSNCQHRMGNYPEALKYLELSKLHIGDDTLSDNMVNYYYGLANNHLSYLDPLSALKSAMAAKEIVTNHALSVDIDRLLSIIFFFLQDYEKTIEISHSVIEKSDSLMLYADQLFGLYSLAQSYDKLGRHELAKSVCQQIFQLREEHNVSIAFGYTYYLLGNIAIIESKLDSAIHYFQLGIDISIQQNEKKELSNCYEGMCKAYSLKGEKKMIKYYADLYLASNNIINPEINSLLASAYMQSGQYKEAYQLLEINDAYWMKQDTSNDKQKLIYTLMNENFKKIQEKSILEQKLQQERIIIEQKNNRLLALGVIASVALLIIMFYFTYRLRLRQQYIEKQKNEIEIQRQHLKQLNNLKDKTFGILAHDLRDSIGGLKALLALVKNAELNSNEFDEMINHSYQNTSAIYDTLNNTLIWSKLQIQGGDLSSQKLNIAVEVDQVGEFLKELIRQKSLHFENNITSNASIFMNKSHLNIILRNLIANAIKFTPKQGSIIVSSEQKEGLTTIRVKDTGIGIDMTKNSNLFEIGSPNWGTEGEKGIGLGLNLCKNIIKQYNGEIYYTSHLGEGSEFCFNISHLGSTHA